MPLADEFTAIDGMWIALAVFLVIVGLTLAYLLLRLAGAAGRLTTLIRGLETSVPDLVQKTGGTVDRVNFQLDKVDLVTDSAVSAADSADTAVRAVSMAVTRPVQKLSSLAKGISHGSSALIATRSVGAAFDAGKDAARRREEELREELARNDRLAVLHQRRLAETGAVRPAADPTVTVSPVAATPSPGSGTPPPGSGATPPPTFGTTPPPTSGATPPPDSGTTSPRPAASATPPLEDVPGTSSSPTVPPTSSREGADAGSERPPA